MSKAPGRSDSQCFSFYGVMTSGEGSKFHIHLIPCLHIIPSLGIIFKLLPHTIPFTENDLQPPSPNTSVNVYCVSMIQNGTIIGFFFQVYKLQHSYQNYMETSRSLNFVIIFTLNQKLWLPRRRIRTKMS